MFPKLILDREKLRHNTASLVQLARSHDISIWGVGKVFCAWVDANQAMVDGGIAALADSRLHNLKQLQQANLETTFVLLRAPSPQQAEQTVAIADLSLNSEMATLEALSRAASQAGKQHRVLLMVDVGDLREGLWPEDVIPFAREAARLPGITISGLGTNLACYGGVVPTEENLSVLVELGQDLERQGIAKCETISGGNSSSIDLLYSGLLPQGINNLRLGEAIILGLEAVERKPIPGLHLDALYLEAEVIEVKTKPSVPIGKVGQDAFGQVPSFEDRGLRRRAILSIGRQDIDPESLYPLAAGIEVIGASSDHLIVDTSNYEHEVSAGQVFAFNLGYGALLKACTSPFVQRVVK